MGDGGTIPIGFESRLLVADGPLLAIWSMPRRLPSIESAVDVLSQESATGTAFVAATVSSHCANNAYGWIVETSGAGVY